MGITFKRHVATGRYRAFALGSTDIKLDGRVVGSISESRETSRWRISLHIRREITEDDPCKFRNVTVTASFANEDDAREFIKNRWSGIAAKYDIYKLEA